MNTYLVPICEVEENYSYFEKIKATNFNIAKDTLSKLLINKYKNILDWSEETVENYNNNYSLSELKLELMYDSIIVGDIYDINEFIDE